jgi:hypothetical protein
MSVAKERVGLNKAVEMLQKLGIEVPPAERVDPREVLLEAVQQAWAIREALRFLTTNLTESEVEGMGKVIKVRTPEGGVSVIPHTGGMHAQNVLKMYNDALVQSARLSKVAIDAGVEERMVKLAERQAEIIISVIKAAVVELPKELQFAVVKRAADELRLRTATPVALPLPAGSSG